MAATALRAREGDKLTVLGMTVYFRCNGPDAGGAWSRMEEDISGEACIKLCQWLRQSANVQRFN